MDKILATNGTYDWIQVSLNGQLIGMLSGEVGYDDIASLVGSAGPDVVYSMTYSYPRNVDKRDGSLYPGGPKIQIVSGMIFNAYVTGNA